MGLVRAICSIIHSAAAAALAVDQVRVPSFVARPGQRVHSRQAVVGHRSGLSCAAVRVEAPLRSGASVHRRVEARLRRSCASRLVPLRLVCCFVSDLAMSISQPTPSMTTM